MSGRCRHCVAAVPYRADGRDETESPMAYATFRFYEELNDFLPPDQRGRRSAALARALPPSAHDRGAGRAPYRGGAGAGERRVVRLRAGWPTATACRSIRPSSASTSRRRCACERPLRVLRFVADAHRRAGPPAAHDRLRHAVRQPFRGPRDRPPAASENRVVLTRDRELLKRRGIDHGCYVRARSSRHSRCADLRAARPRAQRTPLRAMRTATRRWHRCRAPRRTGAAGGAGAP